MLDSSNKLWRREVERELNFTEVNNFIIYMNMYVNLNFINIQVYIHPLEGVKVFLHFIKGHFGGTFKEHLSVASFSPRCYALAVDIMEMYGKWELKRQTNNKVNRMLLLHLPGVRNEDTINRYLREFRQGKLSKAEFNEELKACKASKNQRVFVLHEFIFAYV